MGIRRAADTNFRWGVHVFEQNGNEHRTVSLEIYDTDFASLPECLSYSYLFKSIFSSVDVLIDVLLSFRPLLRLFFCPYILEVLNPVCRKVRKKSFSYTTNAQCVDNSTPDCRKESASDENKESNFSPQLVSEKAP